MNAEVTILKGEERHWLEQTLVERQMISTKVKQVNARNQPFSRSHSPIFQQGLCLLQTRTVSHVPLTSLSSVETKLAGITTVMHF